MFLDFATDKTRVVPWYVPSHRCCIQKSGESWSPNRSQSHDGIWTLKLVWFRYNLSDNHCGIISGIVSRHSLVKVHPKCWSVKWLKVWLTTFFDFFDTQAWKYVPKCPTYPYFPRLSDRLSHFSRHYPRQITFVFNYCMMIKWGYIMNI